MTVKTVITYGTFDMFHIGHLRLLQRMRDLGERVIVAVSTDEFNAIKGKKALRPYGERREVLEALRYVDLVIPEESWEQKVEDITKHSVDTFVMGSDWSGHFDFLRELCEVIYLERTHGVSSTELRESLGRLLSSEYGVEEIHLSLKVLLGDLDR